MPRETVRARPALRLVAAVGAPASRVASIVRRRRRRVGTGGRYGRLIGARRGGLIGGGGSGRAFGPAMRPALAGGAVRAWPARVLFTASGPPDVDEFRGGELALRGNVRRRRHRRYVLALHSVFDLPGRRRRFRSADYRLRRLGRYRLDRKVDRIAGRRRRCRGGRGGHFV